MICLKRFLWFLEIAFCVLLVSCSAASEKIEPTMELQPTVTPTLDFSKNQQIKAVWQRGAHSKISFFPDQANSSCATCHSPVDRDINLNLDEMPGCSEAIVNTQSGLLENNDNKETDLVNWQAVDCESCHRVDDNGQPLQELAWRNTKTGELEAISKPSDLCGKCHTKTSDIDHSIDLGDDIYHSNLTCLDCHDPHSTKASCTDSGCHLNVKEQLSIINYLAVPPNHTKSSIEGCGLGAGCHIQATQVAEQGLIDHIGIQHAFLTCAACHDGAGMEVGPVADSSKWTTFQTVEWNGMSAKRPMFSHVISPQVSCTKCHFEGNPWELKAFNRK